MLCDLSTLYFLILHHKFFFIYTVPLGFQGAIIIHEVYEEGAASKDGRLWAGDQILEVKKCKLGEKIHTFKLPCFF